jgi:hypothetical protein
MANTYKLAAAKILATGSTTLYTTPAATTSIVKNIYISNTTTGSIYMDIVVNKSGSAINYFLIQSASVPVQTSFQPISDPLVLQTGDAVKINTSVVSGSDTLMSYLEIT